MFNESNIGGNDYLRNLVHLPFYLQNAGLRKVKSAQQAALTARNPRGVTVTTNNAAVLNWLESEDAANNPAHTVSDLSFHFCYSFFFRFAHFPINLLQKYDLLRFFFAGLVLHHL